MYPAQLSFIPVSVALTRFVEAGGNIWGNYPYWYLGSTPFKYLTGPVVPFFLAGLHKIFPVLSLFELSIGLIIFALFFGAVGWGFFAGRLSNQRRIGVLVGVISLLLPWHVVSSLGLGEVSAVMASALTPWVLLAFTSSVRHFKKPFGQAFSDTRTDSSDLTHASARHQLNRKFVPQSGLASSYFLKWLSFPLHLLIVSGQLSVVLPSAMFALLLLVNPTASIPTMIGLLILGILLYKHWDKGVKRVALVILFGFILTFWWYVPSFWWTILKAPSFGGKPVVSVFVTLVNLLRGLIPVILAILVVFWGFKGRDKYQKFVILWLSVFGILTLIRFMSDPDFWLDWTAWMGEVEVGFALMFGYFLTRAQMSFQSTEGPWPSANGVIARSKAPSPRKNFILLTLLSVYFVFAWFFTWQNRDLWLPRTDISQTVEYKTANWLANNLTIEQFNNSTIFLSGTTAFWLNSLVDVAQVRGGRDEASVHPEWRQAVWEIREGGITEGTERVLKALKISYLVVHTDESQEFYHDFKYPEKFENISSLTKIYEKDGDVIYRLR